MRLIDADALGIRKFQESECNGFGEGCAYRQGWNDAIDAIIEYEPTLQPEQPKQRWIPCSERLPNLWDERYLVSLAWGGIGVMEYKSTGFHNYGSFSPVPIETVTAWMPLPEPYKEDNDETN